MMHYARISGLGPAYGGPMCASVLAAGRRHRNVHDKALAASAAARIVQRMALEEAFARYRERSREAVEKNLHHDQRRAHLQELLREGFGIDVTDVELERNVRVAEARGRIDLLFRNLVFEVKRDLEREHDDVLRELRLYLSESRSRAFAIAADGKRFEAYRLVRDEIERVNDLALAEVDNETAIAWLDAYLFTQEAIAPTAEDVVRRFGPRSAVFLAAEDELAQMWAQMADEPAVTTKREEWDRLLRVVYGSEKGSDELFLRHTYLAIVARMFAFLAIERSAPRAKEAMEVITGQAFQRLGIENLVEEDFFAWINEPRVVDRARKVAEGIARHLSVYATDLIDEDLLKQLYETLVDPADRHDLGEFYTPDWLADLVLREAEYQPGQRLLDPACGSGTFLFLAIRRLRECGLSGRQLVEEAETNLFGFDVHPLAVTVARANFVLALREDLREARSAVTIPIWMANSLAVPEQRFGWPIEVRVPASRGGELEHFTLPTEMEESAPGSLADAVARMSELGELEVSDDDAAAGLTAALHELGVGQYAETWQANLALFRRLVREKRNTIWAFVLSNAVRPQIAAQSPVDLVVGNPPWLAMRDVAEAVYQDQLSHLALDYGLITQRRGWQTGALELATIFACFSLDHYLRKGGKLAFVLPRGVLFGAKQHEPFRRLLVRPAFAPVKAFDLGEVTPLFNVPSAVAIVRREERPAKPAWPVQKVSGQLPRRNASHDEAAERLTIAEAVGVEATTSVHSPYFDRAIQGATIAPRPFWFVRATSGEATARPWCTTDEDASRRAKEPWTGISLEGRIESEFLFATVLAVYPFRLGPIKLCALPLELRKDGIRLLSPQQVLRAGGSGFYQWMVEGEKLWDERKKGSVAQDVPLYQYLDNHQNMTRQRVGSPRLIYGADGSHVRAAVVSPRNVLRNLQPRPQAFVYDMNTYWVDVKSEPEAHYLAAVLNTPFVDDAIKSVQTQGAWGARHIHRRPFEHLAIPEYDPQAHAHRRLVAISRAAHERLASRHPARTRARQMEPVIELVGEANDLAARICGAL